MSDLSSFYGGRRGFSFNLVKRFDGYDIPTATYCKSYYATSDGTNFIVTDQAHGGNVSIDGGKYLIKKDRTNYLDIDRWVLHNDDGSAIPGNTSYHFPTRYAEGLVQCFDRGVNSLDEVGYGEYVIIDSVANLDNYEDPDNGKLYRRGPGAQGVYDAEYVCQVSGPPGGPILAVVNRNGSEMPKEKFLKLEGALYAEDDPTNHQTKLKVDVPTPESIGIGIGLSEDGVSTGSRTASLSGYVLTKNGIVAVRFTTAVVAAATLNINSKGAKPIYYKNTALVGNVIKAGDTVTFVYDGSKYHILSIDRSEGHVIQDSANTNYASRGKLQFTDAGIADDSDADRTKVNVIRDVMTFAAFEADNNLPDGIYGIKGDDDEQVVLDASMVAYGQGTVKDALDNSVQITVDSELSTTSTNPVQNKVITARLDEVFQSVSNGKALIASAITDKGVPTQSDATFAVMAENISQISGGGGGLIRTTASDILQPLVFSRFIGSFTDSVIIETNNLFFKIITTDITSGDAAIRVEKYEGETVETTDLPHSTSRYTWTDFEYFKVGYDMVPYGYPSFSWVIVITSFNISGYNIGDSIIWEYTEEKDFELHTTNNYLETGYMEFEIPTTYYSQTTQYGNEITPTEDIIIKGFKLYRNPSSSTSVNVYFKVGTLDGSVSWDTDSHRIYQTGWSEYPADSSSDIILSANTTYLVQAVISDSVGDIGYWQSSSFVTINPKIVNNGIAHYGGFPGTTEPNVWVGVDIVFESRV